MATSVLTQILANGLDYIPHIEAGAIKWLARNYAMPSRVKIFSDMEGFNPRKVTEYTKPRRAQTLAEATDIPTTRLLRARRAQIDIDEVGDRYPITDRRVMTDLESIVADSTMALAQSIGDRMEVDLLSVASSTFVGGTLGTSATDMSINPLIDATYEFQKRAKGNLGTIHHVIHPFQAREVMKDLVQFNSTDAGTNLTFRDAAINAWRLPGFQNTEVTVSQFLPRVINSRVRVDGDGGTFKLSVGGLTTAAITVSATPATMATNIKNALDALAIGTWTVNGTGGLLDIEVTSPADLYLFPDEELSVAIDVSTDANVTLDGQKSKFDLVANTTGALGTDLAGEDYGVDIQEMSAYTKSLVFYSDAIALDIRQMPTGFFERVNQGRTGEWSLYAKYGVQYWRPDLGMYIVTKANSALAIP